MIVLKAEDVKTFTPKLFLKEDFDSFLAKEVDIVTYNNFTINGHIRQGYYTNEELEENRIESFSSWKVLCPVCSSLIRGKRLPGSFHIVLLLPLSDTEKFASASGSDISGEQIQGLYLNIRYEDGVLYCVTGTSLNFFTVDRALENEWDRAVAKFMRSHEIICIQRTRRLSNGTVLRKPHCPKRDLRNTVPISSMSQEKGEDNIWIKWDRLREWDSWSVGRPPRKGVWR